MAEIFAAAAAADVGAGDAPYGTPGLADWSPAGAGAAHGMTAARRA
jgi:hypothetical protein